MKSTGITRKVDELGRVVLPIELRRSLGIGEKDALEIYVDGDKIILKKYETDADKEDVLKGLQEILDAATGDDFIQDVLQRAVKLIK